MKGPWGLSKPILGRRSPIILYIKSIVHYPPGIGFERPPGPFIEIMGFWRMGDRKPEARERTPKPPAVIAYDSSFVSVWVMRFCNFAAPRAGLHGAEGE